MELSSSTDEDIENESWLFQAGSPLILAGPTAIGKSSLARTLTHTSGAEIITVDKYYLYANDDLQLGLGLTPDDCDGQKHRLFGVLKPHDPLPTAEEYVGMLTTAVESAHNQNRIAIVEGCSFSYTMAAIGYFGLHHAYRLTFNSMRAARLREVVAHTYNNLVNLGLYQETERALSAGYKDTYPMSSLIYRPAIQVVEGLITPDEAAYLTVGKWLAEVIRTDERYARVPGLLPITPSLGP